MNKYLVSLVLLLALTGCVSIGPNRVQIDRGVYNTIVRDTDEEQLLINIVRQRYLEATQYLQITSLTASYSINSTLGASVGASTSNAPTTWSPSLSPSVSYADTPTISYIPLTSNEFSNSLMTPTTMSNLILLAHAGRYDGGMLTKIFFEQYGGTVGDLVNINGVEYANLEFKKYAEIQNTLAALYKTNDFVIPRPVSIGKEMGVMCKFRDGHGQSKEALKLKKLLKVPASAKEIIFLESPLLQVLEVKDGEFVKEPRQLPKNVTYVKLRSLYAIITLLGRGVQIPPEDIKAHRTRELRRSDGSFYNWTNEMKDIITIYSSKDEPFDDVLIKGKVHGHWFYIKASDPASKDTFIAVFRLYTLTSATADSANTQPVLTIPVAAA